MKNTIEDLYFGNIMPSERDVYQNADYKKAIKEAEAVRSEFEKQLTDAQKVLFNSYVDKTNFASVYSEFSAFLEGFRIASRLMAEALVPKDEEI